MTMRSANRFGMRTSVGLTTALALTALLLTPDGRVLAQEEPVGLGTASVGLLIGVPQGEFHDNMRNVGLGLSFDIAGRFSGSPLHIGGNFAFMIYGQERRREPFSTTIPDVTVDVVTSNNIFQGNLLLRLQPSTGAIRPYIDGLVGFKYFYTRTRIESEISDDNEPIAETTNLDDFTLGYGGGIGLAIRISDNRDQRRETGEGVWAILLDLRLRYLLGGTAEYLTKGSIRRESGQVVYDVSRSKTDMLLPMIGIAIVF